MGEAPTFNGSTASELGTCVHAAANMFVLEKGIHHDKIKGYVNTLGTDIDKDYILEQYPQMVSTLIDQYLSRNTPHITEKFLWHEILPGVGVGGTLDSILFSLHDDNVYRMYSAPNNIIVDYKTTSGSVPSGFSRSYYFQQMVYAYLCKKHGIRIDHLKLVYITTADVNRISEKTGKRLKDYPSTVTEILHTITDDDWNLIEGVINVIAHSVHMWQTQPDIRWALAQDWRLKGQFKAPPKLFKMEIKGMEIITA